MADIFGDDYEMEEPQDKLWRRTETDVIMEFPMIEQPPSNKCVVVPGIPVPVMKFGKMKLEDWEMFGNQLDPFDTFVAFVSKQSQKSAVEGLLLALQEGGAYDAERVFQAGMKAEFQECNILTWCNCLIYIAKHCDVVPYLISLLEDVQYYEHQRAAYFTLGKLIEIKKPYKTMAFDQFAITSSNTAQLLVLSLWTKYLLLNEVFELLQPYDQFEYCRYICEVLKVVQYDEHNAQFVYKYLETISLTLFAMKDTPAVNDKLLGIFEVVTLLVDYQTVDVYPLLSRYCEQYCRAVNSSNAALLVKVIMKAFGKYDSMDDEDKRQFMSCCRHACSQFWTVQPEESDTFMEFYKFVVQLGEESLWPCYTTMLSRLPYNEGHPYLWPKMLSCMEVEDQGAMADFTVTALVDDPHILINLIPDTVNALVPDQKHSFIAGVREICDRRLANSKSITETAEYMNIMYCLIDWSTDYLPIIKNLCSHLIGQVPVIVWEGCVNSLSHVVQVLGNTPEAEVWVNSDNQAQRIIGEAVGYLLHKNINTRKRFVKLIVTCSELTLFPQLSVWQTQCVQLCVDGSQRQKVELRYTLESIKANSLFREQLIEGCSR